MKVNFQTRELCAVNPKDFHWGDQQVSYNVLFDLEDGEEVVSVEVAKNVNNNTYMCHLIIMNKRYEIKIASNARSSRKSVAIATAFEKAKIDFNPSLAEQNPDSEIFAYRINPAMEAIAQELGVKRYKIFSAGIDALLR